MLDDLHRSSANQGSLFGSLCNKDSGILGSVWRQPFYGHLRMPTSIPYGFG